jgi:putative transposase
MTRCVSFCNAAAPCRFARRKAAPQTPLHAKGGPVAQSWRRSARFLVNTSRMANSEMPWPHAPAHQLSEQGTHFVTACTYGKVHHFRGKQRLSVLQRGLLTVARNFGWQIEAWAVFSNHYHFIAHSPADDEDASSLSAMLSILHVKTALWVNGLDEARGRKVWFNFYESRLTYQRSYLARLSYVHQNAVKHGLVKEPKEYPWCSAGWFERETTPAIVRSIYRFKTNDLKVDDDFECSDDW